MPEEKSMVPPWPAGSRPSRAASWRAAPSLVGEPHRAYTYPSSSAYGASFFACSRAPAPVQVQAGAGAQREESVVRAAGARRLREWRSPGAITWAARRPLRPTLQRAVSAVVEFVR